MSKASSESHIEALKKKYLSGAKPLHIYGGIVLTGYNRAGLGGSIMNGFDGPVLGLSQGQLDLRWSEKAVKETLARYIARIEQDWRVPVTTLINCAAIMDLKWFEDYSIKRVREIIETNLIGAYNLSKQFVSLSINKPCPKYIVHIGSMASRVPLNGSAPYCMSKAGLEMMVRCMAWELAPKNYNVLCINPSNIESSPMEERTINLIRGLRKIDRAAATAYWRSGMIRERLLQKKEIVEVIKLFIRGNCSYLSGNAINLTGGLR
jgi:NAD(P)-dependent dehydrogenase (short-subunit alcohol dehydrogenase family)